MSRQLTFQDLVFKYANYPFPSEIANDPMVLYHATSSCFEKEIESKGLKANQIHFTLNELKSIANLFDELGWMGKPGSMSTLKPFSITHDNERHKTKPLYFERSSQLAVGYARYQNSGGEIAKAVRYCFQDLHEFLNNEETRDKHYKKIKLDEERERSAGFLYNAPVQKISLKELELELKKLDHINQRAISFIENSEYGIVYAIKFSAEDANNFLYHNWMGIKYFNDIPPSQIIGKAIVPKEYRHQHSNDYHKFHVPAKHGILALIQKE